MVVLWSISNIHIVKLKFISILGAVLSTRMKLLQLVTYFIVSNLIGDHLFFCGHNHRILSRVQTFVQSLGM